MIILAIDTSLGACSVAMLCDGAVLATKTEMMPKGQAERLASMAQEVLSQAGVALTAIDRIAVTSGPGAFTGLRVGLAFGRGLALALDRPCLGLSTLEIFAAQAAAPKVLAAIKVAGHLFVSAWDGRCLDVAPCKLDETSATVREFLDSLTGDWTLAGPGLEALAVYRPDWPYVSQTVPDPVILGQLAGRYSPDERPPNPLYLRGADAKLPGGRLLQEETRI